MDTSLVDWHIVFNTDEHTCNAVSVLKGEKLSASDFAYTPDKDSPSTWKLRIDDARHVAGAMAALGKGFRGHKVSIPSRDLPGVKRRVEAAWRKFHGKKATENEERRFPWDYNEPGDEDEEDYDEEGDMLRNQDEEEDENDEEGDDKGDRVPDEV
jgi:hypothetical protein